MIDQDLCIVLYDNRYPFLTRPEYYKKFWDSLVYDDSDELLKGAVRETNIAEALKPYNARTEIITGRDATGLYTQSLVIFENKEDMLSFILEWS